MLSLTIFIALISYSFGCNVAAEPEQEETAKLHIVSKENKTHSLLESYLIRDTEEDLVEDIGINVKNDNVGKLNEDNDIPNISTTISHEDLLQNNINSEDILFPQDFSIKPTKKILLQCFKF